MPALSDFARLSETRNSPAKQLASLHSMGRWQLASHRLI